jgi:ArsR family transcriptional regulator
MAVPSHLDHFLRAVADPTRRRILKELKPKGRESKNGLVGLYAGEIVDRVKLAQPTISHHMKILQKANLVEAQRKGHKRHYRRNEKLIAEMTRALKAQL